METLVRKFLAKKGFSIPSDTTYSHIIEWLEWYQGEVEKFHSYKVFNGVTVKEQKRYRLGMAKKICEDWANLLLNEKTAIKAGDFEKQLEIILKYNNFGIKGNQLIEMAFALGTGAFVEYKDGFGNVVIDYIRADLIYPLSWENGDITECAFGTTKVINGEECVYLQLHRFDNGIDESPDTYYIESCYINAETGEELDAPDNIEPIVNTGYHRPLFQIITPNICNNIDLDSPLGISVYANSISQLKSADIVYDSYVNEFVLGKKRILVPITAAQKQMQTDGVAMPVFDPNDNVYYQMPGDRQSDMQLTEIDMSIRASEHELGIQRSLDLLSLKVGMGTGRYQFSSSGVKTATEVISDKSDLYQNRQRNSIIIREVVISLVQAVAFLATGEELEDVSVDFDDSIIEDTNTTIDRNIKLVNAGLRSKLAAVMEIDKCSEEEAAKELKRIASEAQINGNDIDWTNIDDPATDNEDKPEEESNGSEE